MTYATGGMRPARIAIGVASRISFARRNAGSPYEVSIISRQRAISLTSIAALSAASAMPHGIAFLDWLAFGMIIFAVPGGVYDFRA